MSKARIAILGAGPTGLEAALAAAENGYDFTLYEAAERVAGNVRDWGHVRLFSPWELDVSPRMRARLEREGIGVPAGDDCPSGDELADALFEPVARLPEIAPRLRLATRVRSVGRQGLLKHEAIGAPERRRQPFRLLIANGDGGDERIDTADIVLDCTGSYEIPNRIGDGGIPAPGEEALAARIDRRIPDVERDGERYAGKRILLVGAGHSAQTAAAGLAELAERHRGTEIVWALRRNEPTWPAEEDDPLPARARLARTATRLASAASPHVTAILGVAVEALAERDKRIVVTLRQRDGANRELTVDRIVALTGSVGDHALYRQLQVHECYATSGPMKLAAALLGQAGGGGDCLAQTSLGADTLVNPEPGFFVLGAKSYGRNSTFLMRVGWQQVEEVFGLLAAE